MGKSQHTRCVIRRNARQGVKMESQNQTSLRALKFKQGLDRMGVSRSTARNKLGRNPKRLRDYDASFPKPILLGDRALGFLECEVDDWLRIRAANRFSAPRAMAANGSENQAVKGGAE